MDPTRHKIIKGQQNKKGEYAVCDTGSMREVISTLSKSDALLLELLDRAREYAEIYVMAKKRQKGCDGLGELAMVREEFRDIVDRVIHHCKTKQYISGVTSYDTDSIADEIERLSERCL